MIEIGKDGVTVKMTRGDYFETKIDLLTQAGEPYTPQQNDTIKFHLKHAKMTPGRLEFDDDDPLVEKDIDTTELTLILEHADTAGLDFGDYRYDVKLYREGQKPDTFIENALWRLCPDVGGKTCPTEPTEPNT